MDDQELTEDDEIPTDERAALVEALDALDDVDAIDQKRVQEDGKLYLGKEYAGQTVRYAVSKVRE